MTADLAQLIDILAERGETIAVAESLTGGLLTAALVEVPGVSRVLRGGIVAYATDLKSSLVGVPAGLLADQGPVDPEVAIALARGARERCVATWGLGTTGVAGPGPQGGIAVGVAYVAIDGPGITRVRSLRLDGDRAMVRQGAVAAALDLLRAALT